MMTLLQLLVILPIFGYVVNGTCFGSSTSSSTYPYVAALRYTSDEPCCSGTIISLNPGIILTAAHCNGCTGAVRIGCNDPSNCDGDQYPISQFIQNPSYGSPLQFSNDIAIVRLQSPITTAGATAIQIPSDQPSGNYTIVTAYGITQSGSIPASLQTANTQNIENTQCQAITESVLGGASGQYVGDSMLCIRGGSAGQENVPTACMGDSGGPMVIGNYVVGVISWVLQGSGSGCNSCKCCPGYPQVGANIVSNLDFINVHLSRRRRTLYLTDEFEENNINHDQSPNELGHFRSLLQSETACEDDRSMTYTQCGGCTQTCQQYLKDSEIFPCVAMCLPKCECNADTPLYLPEESRCIDQNECEFMAMSIKDKSPMFIVLFVITFMSLCCAGITVCLLFSKQNSKPKDNDEIVMEHNENIQFIK